MRALAWSAAVVAAVWLIMSATYPFGWDQGIFAWAGGVIVDGGLPYRDAWDLKGPLVYYVYALAQALLGAGLWSIRILDAAALLLTAWAVARALVTFTDRTLARFGAVLFVLWYASFSYWHTAQPDGWTGMLLAGAAAALLTRPDALTSRRAALAGLACGLAALFKPLWLLFVLVAAIPLWQAGADRRLRLVLSLAAGCVAPIGVALLWFAAHGALDVFWRVHVLDAAAYASLVPVDRMSGLLESVTSSRAAFVIVPLAAVGGVGVWRSNRGAAAFFFSWIAVVFVGVWIQGRFFGYHWLPAMPAIAILAAIGLAGWLRANRPVATVSAALAVALVAAPVVYEEARFGSWLAGRMPTEAYYDAYGQSGPEMRAVAWMRREARPGDVFVFGWNPGIAWLTGRTIVSRFGFSMPLLSGPDAVRDRYVAETMRALEQNPPAYFIEGDLSVRILGRSATLADVPDLARFVERGYREVARFGPIVIRERKGE